MDVTLSRANQLTLLSPCLLEQLKIDSKSRLIYENTQSENVVAAGAHYSSINCSSNSYSSLQIIKSDEAILQQNSLSLNATVAVLAYFCTLLN